MPISFWEHQNTYLLSLTPSLAFLSASPPLPVSLSVNSSHPYTVAVGPVTFSSIKRSLNGLSWKKGRVRTSLLSHKVILERTTPPLTPLDHSPKPVCLHPTLKSWRS